MPENLPGIIGQPRALIDALALLLHKGIRTRHEYKPIIEDRRGSHFDVRLTDPDGEPTRFIARITVELLPADNADSVKLHVTTVHHDGFKHYFTCSAGDVTHTDNAYDTPAEAEIAAEGHRARFGRSNEPNLATAVERAKAEILAEIQAGRFSADEIATFADLHDHMDANTLGGLADDAFPLSSEAQIAFGNELQGAIDQWIRDGGLTEEHDHRS